MNKPHKWAKEIKAWADGATIQVRMVSPTVQTSWDDIPLPKWNGGDECEYRIKPREPREWWLMYDINMDRYCVVPDYELRHHTTSKLIKVREVLE